MKPKALLKKIQERLEEIDRLRDSRAISPERHYRESRRLEAQLVNVRNGRTYSNRWHRDSDPFDPHADMKQEWK